MLDILKYGIEFSRICELVTVDWFILPCENAIRKVIGEDERYIYTKRIERDVHTIVKIGRRSKQFVYLKEKRTL